MEKLGRHGTTGVTFKCEPEKKTLLHVHADHSGNAVKNRLKSHLQESNVLKLLGRVRSCMTLVKCMRIHHEAIITSGYFLSRFLLNICLYLGFYAFQHLS